MTWVSDPTLGLTHITVHAAPFTRRAGPATYRTGEGAPQQPPPEGPEEAVNVRAGLARLPGPKGERWVEMFRHGTLEVEVYAPRTRDPQTPHTRDEVYVVVRGMGIFVNGSTREPFGPGDLLFVPAGMTHRFEDFTDDLVMWVIFYGPEGGEAAAAGAS